MRPRAQFLAQGNRAASAVARRKAKAQFPTLSDAKGVPRGRKGTLSTRGQAMSPPVPCGIPQSWRLASGRGGTPINVAPAAADHGRRNDRRADGATVHRLDNRYESHGGPPRGRSLDHADALYHALSPADAACSDQGSASLFRRHAHRPGRLQRVEGGP